MVAAGWSLEMRQKIVLWIGVAGHVGVAICWQGGVYCVRDLRVSLAHG